MQEGTDAFEGLGNTMLSQSIPAGVFHVLGGIPSFGTGAVPTAPARTCPSCGTTYEAFRKTGLLGCPDCYETFSDRMEQIFARVQASGRHTGRVYKGSVPVSISSDAVETPAGAVGAGTTTPSAQVQPAAAVSEIDTLRGDLRAAIGREDYEEAARLRDRIRALETGQAKEGDA
jgi:protein arginine kinase activator